jgi:hypothetical protein
VADAKLSALTERGAAVVDADLLYTVSGATSYKLLASRIKTYTSASPTLVTPALGTPASGTLTSCTGLPISTGVSGLGTGVATFLATPSSANLAAAVTDETGTGALVLANTPTLVTPVLGTPASGTLTNCTGLPVGGISATGTPNSTTYLRGDGSWQTVSGGSSPGGSDTQVQFNDGGSALGGDAGLTYNKTSKVLTNTGGQVVLTGGTVTTSTPVIDATQTWNNGAVTFTGLKLNVTNTASATGSMLMDLQVGGSSILKVLKSGEVSIANVAHFASQTGTTIGGSQPVFRLGASSSTYAITRGDSRSTAFGLDCGQIKIASDGYFGFNSGTDIYAGSVDTFIYRDAANVVAHRNSTTAQTFRVYNTYTDSSNYQRLTLAWNTTTALVHNEGAGTGADGSVAFNDAALATNATKGFIMIPSCAGVPSGVPADIPTGQIPIVFDSTNNKLYAYDGGWISTAALT